MIDFKYEYHKKIEKLWFWFIWKLPRKLIYFSAIRLGVNATIGEYENTVVPELTFIDALKRWDTCPKR